MNRQMIYTRPYRSLPVRIIRWGLLFLFIGAALEGAILGGIFFRAAFVQSKQEKQYHPSR